MAMERDRLRPMAQPSKQLREHQRRAQCCDARVTPGLGAGRAVGGSFEIRPPVGRAIELRLGADARLVDGESRELYAFNAGEPTRRRIAGGNSRTEGAFTELTWTSAPLTVTAGGRVDHWTISDGRLVERFLASGQATRDDQYPDRSGWLPTARAGAVLDVGRGLSLRSAAYLGWRMPTLNELFRPFRVGADATAANPLLDPERLRGAEAGIRYVHGGASLSATLFVNRLSDAIANVTLGHGPGNFPGVGFVAGDYRQRLNVRALKVRGIELGGDLVRGPWSLRLDASYADARLDARGMTSALDGLRPAQTPRLAVTGSIGWARAGRSMTLLIEHVGSQYEDDLNERRLRPATTFGAFAAWPVGKGLQLIARAENLLDTTIVAGMADDGTMERATPRTLWVGIRAF